MRSMLLCALERNPRWLRTVNRRGLNSRPFRSLKGNPLCALPFCPQPVDTYNESHLCYYHRCIAIGRMKPEVDKYYDEEAKRILREAR